MFLLPHCGHVWPSIQSSQVYSLIDTAPHRVPVAFATVASMWEATIWDRCSVTVFTLSLDGEFGPSVLYVCMFRHYSSSISRHS